MGQQRVRVLLVDDEKRFLETVSARIRLKGFEPVTASSGEEAIEAARRTDIQIAIIDYKMPGMDGVVTITKLKEIKPGMKTVLLTGYGDAKLKEAAEALDADYFEKGEMRSFWNFIRQFNPDAGMVVIAPPSGPDIAPHPPEDPGLRSAPGAPKPEELEMYAARQALEKRTTAADEDLSMFSGPRGQRLIGETPAVLDLKRNIRKVASLDCTVLVLGETGTGKELVAKAIHLFSPRRQGKFMAVNCSSFSEELLSNELFGHEKEAFTGAVHRKKGVIEAASGGTILLDEIGDTPLPMQVKLLRFLQEKIIIRVGGTDEIPVDVRVLAATNRSLDAIIHKGEFREDLYYRLNAFVLRVPPLRERREDIPLLCSYFLGKYRKEFGKDINRISDEVLSVFRDYPFPGNVRELENAIERAVIVCEGSELNKAHLPRRFKDARSEARPDKKELLTLAQVEERHIRKVLEATGGNKSEAARILGINRASLWRKLKQLNGQGTGSV